MKGNSDKLNEEDAMEILKKHNVIISKDQATKILAFMDHFSKLFIKQYQNK